MTTLRIMRRLAADFVRDLPYLIETKCLQLAIDMRDYAARAGAAGEREKADELRGRLRARRERRLEEARARLQAVLPPDAWAALERLSADVAAEHSIPLDEAKRRVAMTWPDVSKPDTRGDRW